MKFIKGERVKRLDIPEWDIGQVLEESFEEKVRVFFVGVGEKHLKLSLANLTKVQGDEAHSSLLDNLTSVKSVKKGKVVQYRNLNELIVNFKVYSPEGFYGDTYLQRERNHKEEAHNLIMNLLDKESFNSLLTSQSYNEICKRAMQVVNKTNLVFPNEKMSLRDGLKSERHEEQFSEKLYYLLHGDDELKKRFNAFSDCLMDLKAAKWTTATYFLFIMYPEQEMFLKPTVTQKAADICRFELDYRPEPNWFTYHRLREFSQYLLQELSELEPRDMIDVQSFIWSTARIEEGLYVKN